LTQQLKTFALNHQTILSTVRLSAFAILLQHYSGQTDIWIGMPTRADRQTQFVNLVGCLDNHIALRVNFGQMTDLTFKQLLEPVWQTGLTALEHQTYPGLMLIKGLSLQRHTNHPELFQTTFNFMSTELIDRSLNLVDNLAITVLSTEA
jgi:non-ribosomal peptide synthetase component F